MGRIVVGFGNDLRGEDGFGIEVIEELRKYHLCDTKLISIFQLTPELALELKEFDEIIFVDAADSSSDHYALACNLETTQHNTLSHHISIETILGILHTLYGHFPKFQVYSILTDHYESIGEQKKYKERIATTAACIASPHT